MGCKLRSSLGTAATLAIALGVCACQSYPFEFRTPRRSSVQKTEQLVLTVRPTDILFVIDNSGSMMEERALIRSNVASFLDGLTQSATDFHVGLVTTDVECNLPTLDCSSGTSSASCCDAPGRTLCQDSDSDGDGKLDATNCDGGRLRSASGANRIFSRPTAAERQDWITRFSDSLASLDCDPANQRAQGSDFEAGLEAMVRAVGCSVGSSDCTDANVAQLNAGFIRPEADLVVIFITDEDDCSFDTSARPAADPLWRPATTVAEASDATFQQTHLCSARECYSYYFGGHPDNYTFLCGTAGVPRTQIPPTPTDVAAYLDKLVAYKGDAARIRAAAIVGGVPDTRDSLAGFNDGACYIASGTPSLDCSCLSTSPGSSGALYCSLTTLLGQHSAGTNGITHYPPGGTPQDVAQCINGQDILPGVGNNGGCSGLPGTRYSKFIRALSQRHLDAGRASDVLIDSICQARYDDTLYKIVNNIIIKNCFELSMAPTSVSDVSVSLNGTKLSNVDVRSSSPGWSWVVGSKEICLEGGLKKTVNDRFEIYVLSPEQ